MGVFDETAIAAEEVLVLDTVCAAPVLEGVTPLGGKAGPSGQGDRVDGLVVRARRGVAGGGGVLAAEGKGLDESEDRGLCSRSRRRSDGSRR